MLIGLAGLNAIGVHTALAARCSDVALRAFGPVSLGLWIMVVFTGRMLAFG